MPASCWSPRRMRPDLDGEEPVHEYPAPSRPTLLPQMNVQQAVAAFDRAEAEALAVVDAPDRRSVIGLLTEAYALRRYAEESEKRRRSAVRRTLDGGGRDGQATAWTHQAKRGKIRVA